MTDDTKIPADHPIHKVWEANEKLRSVPGLIDLAERGDQYAAKQLLARFCKSEAMMKDDHERGSQPLKPRHYPELMDYLVTCFTKILNGDDPSAALNLSPGKGSGKRGQPPSSAAHHQKLARIGRMVACKIDQYGPGGYNRALFEVAQEVHCSKGTADRAYQMYMKGTIK